MAPFSDSQRVYFIVSPHIYNAEFYADFRTVEKVAKNAHTKSYKETNIFG
jgi:hypothetical protein